MIFFELKVRLLIMWPFRQLSIVELIAVTAGLAYLHEYMINRGFL